MIAQRKTTMNQTCSQRESHTKWVYVIHICHGRRYLIRHLTQIIQWKWFTLKWEFFPLSRTPTKIHFQNGNVISLIEMTPNYVELETLNTRPKKCFNTFDFYLWYEAVSLSLVIFFTIQLWNVWTTNMMKRIFSLDTAVTDSKLDEMWVFLRENLVAHVSINIECKGFASI